MYEAKIKTMDGANLTVIFSNGHKERFDNKKQYVEFIKDYEKKKKSVSAPKKKKTRGEK